MSEFYESGGEDTGVFDRWTQKELVVKKFVDDISGAEKIHANNIYASKVSDGLETRYLHAVQSQRLFDQVALGAAEKGMKLNEKKTTLLCINAARTYKPISYINLGGGDVVLSGKSMKLLGFHFDCSPSAGAHVKSVLKKVRYRTWMIYHLKRLGMTPPGLINVYCSLIRPCFDYASVVYNSMLTKTQSEALERQQRKVLKIIYGWDSSYACLLYTSPSPRD